MPKLISVCVECGIPFAHFPSQQRQTCSRHCKGVRQHRERSLAGKPSPGAIGGQKRRNGTMIPCAVCGTEVYRRPNQLAATTANYCSPECRIEATRKERVIKPCAHCGKEMRLKPSVASRGKQYCSRACQSYGTTTAWTFLERTHNGRFVKKDRLGYVWVWEPERIRHRKQAGVLKKRSYECWYQEHRLVMEIALGRELTRDEHVHHVNGQKDDNRLENLQVMAWGEHAALSLSDWMNLARTAIAEREEYRRLYGPLPTAPAPPDPQ
jgi:hypothetical protein